MARLGPIQMAVLSEWDRARSASPVALQPQLAPPVHGPTGLVAQAAYSACPRPEDLEF